ncbi:glycosyltransferase family 4 protein [Telmatobacter sp. DSM 110680]|uniref:Glycosyltransferase family 4 protein n=1 Tax=Telmatobacter sp. DSM 110680 TaxID=3036704 RepID=A0AAU7DFE1_9BACT
MKILLSAYACEPNKGSEPGVGWNWALALRDRGFDVHVLTRSNNREAIEQVSNLPTSRLTFHFYDLPQRLRFWKHWPGGIYLYYLLWQVGAYRIAKRLHSTLQFGLVHHITFVSYRQPSFMGSLGIPFVFGPVGGGETMPSQFRDSLPLGGRLIEWFRDLGNRAVGLDPLMQRTYSSARLIACATGETLDAIPARFHAKCIVQRAIGISAAPEPEPSAIAVKLSRPQLLFVGRLLYWKGLHLLLRALSNVRDAVPGLRLRIIGEGADGRWLKQEARRWKVDDLVDWIARVPHHEMANEYRNSSAFIFPSLHDSGGMVVLEALSAGLPVICLNVGGPGSIVDSSCGFSVEVGRKSENEIIEELSDSVKRMCQEHKLRSELSVGARNRASTLTWSTAVEAIYSQPSVREHANVGERMSMI